MKKIIPETIKISESSIEEIEALVAQCNATQIELVKALFQHTMEGAEGGMESMEEYMSGWCETIKKLPNLEKYSLNHITKDITIDLLEAALNVNIATADFLLDLINKKNSISHLAIELMRTKDPILNNFLYEMQKDIIN